MDGAACFGASQAAISSGVFIFGEHCAPKIIEYGGDMDYLEMTQRVWELARRKLEAAAKEPGSSPNQIALQLKVSPSTVYRWLSGERGERVTLVETFRILAGLGVSMSAVIKELFPEDAETALRILALGDPEFLSQLAEVIARGGDDFNKIKSDVAYAYKKGKAD